MSNPKDWFGRHRAMRPVGDTAEPGDPFINDAVLELGDPPALLRQSREPVAAPRAATIPPPPRPEGTRREGRVIERSAFAIRPQLSRRAEAPRSVDPMPPSLVRTAPSPAATAEQSRGEPREGAVATFAPRRSGAFRIDPLAARAAARPLPIPAEPPGPPPEPARRSESKSPDAPPAGIAAAAADGAPAEEDPAFTLTAPGPAWMRSPRPAGHEAGRLNALLREAFTPTRPKQNAALFSGRYKQMQRIIAAIEEERAHVVIYGERGSGKTSLANVLAGKAEEAGYYVLRFACSSELTFEEIFRSFLRRLPASFLADGIGAGSRVGVENFEQLLPAGHFGVAELVAVFERIYDRHVILIIDEYDRVTGEETKNKLAELVKIMSDASAPVTILLIGVADDVRELFGRHPSLQRTLVTVPMPMMSRREMGGIILAGEEKSGLRFEPDVRQSIIDFAQGLPYHAQLLCLFAARNAVRRRSGKVERPDLRYAAQRAAEEAESRIRDAYDLAIGTHEQQSFADVLFYAARCKSDEFGMFTAADVAAAAEAAQAESSLLSLQYPLKKLTEPERGAVLRRAAGPAGLRYQFCSQMMRHYVLLRQAEQRGLI